MNTHKEGTVSTHKESTVSTLKECEELNYEQKNRQLYLRQKELLDTYLKTGAITKEQYSKSFHDLTQKMGFGMDISGIDYLGFQCVIDRGTADIIEETEEVLFLYDRISEAYMLACDDPKLAVSMLKKHEDFDIGLLMTTSREAAEYVRDAYGLPNLLECYQFAYLGEAPEEDPRITVRTATMDDIPTIMKSYDQISEEEMAKDIHRGGVLMAYDGDELVGFIGEHLEGSQGMLYVYPKHRRKGYAAALENAVFARTIRKGRIPFGQVIAGNTASMELQKKNGLTQADRLIYWAW